MWCLKCCKSEKDPDPPYRSSYPNEYKTEGETRSKITVVPNRQNNNLSCEDERIIEDNSEVKVNDAVVSNINTIEAEVYDVKLTSTISTIDKLSSEVDVRIKDEVIANMEPCLNTNLSTEIKESDLDKHSVHELNNCYSNAKDSRFDVDIKTNGDFQKYLKCVITKRHANILINNNLCLFERNMHCLVGTSKEMFCILCDKDVSSIEKKNHLNDYQHNELVKLKNEHILAEFGYGFVSEIDFRRLYHCGVCNTVMLTLTEVKSHCMTPLHDEKLRKFMDKAFFVLHRINKKGARAFTSKLKRNFEATIPNKLERNEVVSDSPLIIFDLKGKCVELAFQQMKAFETNFSIDLPQFALDYGVASWKNEFNVKDFFEFKIYSTEDDNDVDVNPDIIDAILKLHREPEERQCTSSDNEPPNSYVESTLLYLNRTNSENVPCTSKLNHIQFKINDKKYIKREHQNIFPTPKNNQIKIYENLGSKITVNIPSTANINQIKLNNNIEKKNIKMNSKSIQSKFNTNQQSSEKVDVKIGNENITSSKTNPNEISKFGNKETAKEKEEFQEVSCVEKDGFILNNKVNVNLENWHCFKQQNFCLLCEIKTPNMNRHITTDKCHSINLKLRQKKFLKQYVQDFICKLPNQSNKFQCVVCNKYFTRFVDIKTHTKCLNHKQCLEYCKNRFQTYNANTKKLPNMETDTVKLSVDSKKKTISEYKVKSLRHVYNRGVMINEQLLITSKCWNVCVGTNKYLECLVCRYRQGINYYTHHQMKIHINNLKKHFLLGEFSENLIRKVPNNEYYCSICKDVYKTREEIKQHIQTQLHINSLEIARAEAVDALKNNYQYVCLKY